MSDQSVEFASLLCSRLCHDLMSPVGAIGNGLELLADETDPGLRASCLDLVADSQRASADKLKFFRIAFGAGGGFGDDIAATEVREVLEGFMRGKAKVELGWLIEQPGVARTQARLLLNLALIGYDALVRGGRLDVGVDGGEVVVRAEGPRLILDPETRAVLAGESRDAPTARTAPAWLVRKLAEDAGGQVALADDTAGVLLLAATLPG